MDLEKKPYTQNLWANSFSFPLKVLFQVEKLADYFVYHLLASRFRIFTLVRRQGCIKESNQLRHSIMKMKYLHMNASNEVKLTYPPTIKTHNSAKWVAMNFLTQERIIEMFVWICPLIACWLNERFDLSLSYVFLFIRSQDSVSSSMTPGKNVMNSEIFVFLYQHYLEILFSLLLISDFLCYCVLTSNIWRTHCPYYTF